jgi:hypothetical protein
MNTLHGDADLFVSRTQEFPNKIKHEKGSTLGRKDLVYFDGSEENTISSLQATYYVSVFGYQYSTYTLIATIERKSSTSIFASALSLVEGVAVEGVVDSAEGELLYKLDVRMQEGYEKGIQVLLTPVQGQFSIYASWQEKPNSTHAHFKGSQNSITISPNNRHFHRVGTYFILV